MNDDKLPFSLAPGDYTLFELGEYDDCTGQMTMHEAKISLGTATEFIRSNQPRGELS